MWHCLPLVPHVYTLVLPQGLSLIILHCLHFVQPQRLHLILTPMPTLGSYDRHLLPHFCHMSLPHGLNFIKPVTLLSLPRDA